MKQFWDKRYAGQAYAYGTEPNVFLKKTLNQLPPGKILLPCEGEGRNAIYAASLGWEVYAFDQSIEGQKKALRLAKENGVSIKYLVNGFETVQYPANYFDVIALTFAHFIPEFRQSFHRKLIPYLKKDGLLILEGFSLNNLNYKNENGATNGPKNPDMLFTKALILNDFNALACRYIEEIETTLQEGIFHQGICSIIQYIGTKN
jgi:cyclopropane fatty-acyl-phospholipid synthase-like methyltransferase